MAGEQVKRIETRMRDKERKKAEGKEGKGNVKGDWNKTGTNACNIIINNNNNNNNNNGEEEAQMRRGVSNGDIGRDEVVDTKEEGGGGGREEEEDASASEALNSRLHGAIRGRDVGTVRRLLARGADPDEPDWNGTGDAPILVAAAVGSEDIVRALCAAGCEVNARTARGETSLHVCVASRRLHAASLVRPLLDAGCDANIQENLHGCTALHVMARHMASPPPAPTPPPHLHVFRHLATCSDVNVRDHRQRTALHRLVAAGVASLEPYQVLLDAGADPSAQNGRGETPLVEAADKDSALEAASLLLVRSGTDLGLATAYGEAALHVAARRGRPALVAALLQRGANPNPRDLRANTPLHLAAARGYVEVTSLLMHATGVEVNASNKEGLTPLHVAVESGFIEVVKVLLTTDHCDVTARTLRSLTPLDLAQEGYRRRSQPEMSVVLAREMERRGHGHPMSCH